MIDTRRWPLRLGLHGGLVPQGGRIHLCRTVTR